MAYEHRFDFKVGNEAGLSGVVQLEDVERSALAFRTGALKLADGKELPLCLTHSEATERFMYLGEADGRSGLNGILDTLGCSNSFARNGLIPGQFILGAARTRLVMAGVRDCMRSPSFGAVFSDYGDGEIVALPILREGMKYGLGEAVLEVGGRLCDEIVVDAHHVSDALVPGLGRRMELTVFKDRDLSEAERDAVKVAVLGDSVASGTVIVGLVEELARRFPNLERIELVAPLAAVYGLARIAAFSRSGAMVRIHCFETLINALPPDYYYSPHFNEAEMHICPDAQRAYREWWGQDRSGDWIADTACSGYGWSEAFFNPGKQLRMIEEELLRRHGLTLKAFLDR
ncbi:hypothetical protein JIN87_26195 [Pelagicoccus mobilis]|uniref:Uncharacterized protein n=2 Tax=Pelagicoccus mobilis TaxID=415221 RepID=A0A934S6R6_9BACT|nr:hypothetical protein [Pelagicoccus mobilis]